MKGPRFGFFLYFSGAISSNIEIKARQNYWLTRAECRKKQTQKHWMGKVDQTTPE